MLKLDFNSDLGENFGLYKLGDDTAVLSQISSANVACGFHAGDPQTIAATVRNAVANGVSVGAHPGFQDLQGFGRRAIQMSHGEIYNLTVYQVGAVKAFAEAAGSRLAHVKAHGALYNMAAKDLGMARALAEAVHDVDSSLVFFGLAGSELVRAGREAGLHVAEEVFADRSYQADGSLTPRGQPGAMITDVDTAISQVLRMVREGVVRSQQGVDVPVKADTLCIHGDQPGAATFARDIRAALIAEGIDIRPPQATYEYR
ncbi:lactam utilization protein LamB [Cupriavidus pauculus]|uniref:5-oxoprolinase subunit A n=1 Tax=Cupriavidus pauculus TaxID=82633 RepID=A0A2N5C3K7_9BURK|nr:lactam utilization protein LamB [Cupriavidus pauculus]